MRELEVRAVEFLLDVRREPLAALLEEPYGSQEAAREGFTGMMGAEFVAMFRGHNGCTSDTDVTRIEFDYTRRQVS